jgi:hypothetical protein
MGSGRGSLFVPEMDEDGFRYASPKVFFNVWVAVACAR